MAMKIEKKSTFGSDREEILCLKDGPPLPPPSRWSNGTPLNANNGQKQRGIFYEILRA